MSLERIMRWAQMAKESAAAKRRLPFAEALTLADQHEIRIDSLLAYLRLREADRGARWGAHVTDCNMMERAERLARSDMSPATRIALLASQENQ